MISCRCLLANSKRKFRTLYTHMYKRGKREGKNITKEKVELDASTRQIYEEMKAMFPYETPWKINNAGVKIINSTSELFDKFDCLLDLRDVENFDLANASYMAQKEKREVAYLAECELNEEDKDRRRSTILLWMRGNTIRNWHLNELRNAELFGMEIVIDCGFEPLLKTVTKFRKMLTDQILKLMWFNRTRHFPLKIVLCNLAEDSQLRMSLEKHADVHRHHFITMTSKSYLDLFDRKDLVYLSGDSLSEITSVDKSRTYILGGLPDDKNIFVKATNIKARRDGVETQKFPFSRYISIVGSGHIPLHRAFMLMSAARESGMKKAIAEVIPKKKQHDMEKIREASRLSTFKSKEKAKTLRRLNLNKPNSIYRTRPHRTN